MSDLWNDTPGGDFTNKYAGALLDTDSVIVDNNLYVPYTAAVRIAHELHKAEKEQDNVD